MIQDKLEATKQIIERKENLLIKELYEFIILCAKMYPFKNFFIVILFDKSNNSEINIKIRILIGTAISEILAKNHIYKHNNDFIEYCCI